MFSPVKVLTNSQNNIHISVISGTWVCHVPHDIIYLFTVSDT